MSLDVNLDAKKQKASFFWNEAKLLIYMGWLMGLEPTTTGITILKNDDLLS